MKKSSGNGSPAADLQDQELINNDLARLRQENDRLKRKLQEIETRLRKKCLEYDALFENAPCFITIQDREFRVLKYNKEFAQRFSPDKGVYCYQAYKGRNEPCEICPVRRTFEDGKPHTSEESGTNKDGEWSCWIARTFPLKDDAGNVVAAIEMCLDTTQMKMLEQEVRRSEEKYRIIFNTIPNPVFVLEAMTMNIVDCNDSVRDVYGYSRGELLGKSFLSIFKYPKERYIRALKTSNVINRIQHVRKDGKVIYVDMRVSSSDYLGMPVYLVTTSDITEQLMAEQQLIQASKMATLGEMATGIAHELNQPLSVIKTASSFLKKKTSGGESIDQEVLKTLANEIGSYVDRATKIIQHMREFGRKSEVEVEPVSIEVPIKRALEIFSKQLSLREIEVVEEFDIPLPKILADANRLEQVFVNLLINARDAIEEKTKCSKSEKVEKRIILRAWARQGKVFAEIEDTGIGIPDQIMDKVFEPFFTTKPVGKGTGLGLSISYGIVQDYDGTIHLDSTEGVGTKFTLSFPALDDTNDKENTTG